MKQQLVRNMARLVLSAVIAVIAVTALAVMSPQGIQAGSPAGATTCGPVVYVTRGDSLSLIASRCGTSVQALLRANPSIWHPDIIFVGQALNVPGAIQAPTPVPTPVTGNGSTIYVVQRGDTLYSIANRFSTTVTDLMILNPNIRSGHWIYVGQRLRVPQSGNTSNWLTYESSRHGFKFRYPANWKLTAEVAAPGQNNDRETVTLFQPGYGVPGKFTRIFVYAGKNGYVMRSPQCDSTPVIQGVTACRSSYYGPQSPPQELLTFEKGGSYFSMQLVYEQSSDIPVYNQVLTTFQFTR